MSEKGDKRTVVISAPSSDIGKVITQMLLEDHYYIIGIGRESSQQTIQNFVEKGYNVDFIKCHYTSENEVKQAFSRAKKITPHISGLIHFVGGSLLSKKIEDLTYDDFDKVLKVNLYSAFLVGREAYSWMKDEGGGNIIFFSSTTAFQPSKKKLPYAVSKAGVNALTLSFALEGADYNIITNSIAPGYVMTDRHKHELEKKAKNTDFTFEQVLERVEEKNVLNQTLYPRDIYPLVRILLSTKHIHGQTIRIDSGQILNL